MSTIHAVIALGVADGWVDDEPWCRHSYAAWDGAIWACILRRRHSARWNHQLQLVVEPAPVVGERGEMGRTGR